MRGTKTKARRVSAQRRPYHGFADVGVVGKLHAAFAVRHPHAQDRVLHALEHNGVRLLNLDRDKAGLVAAWGGELEGQHGERERDVENAASCDHATARLHLRCCV